MQIKVHFHKNGFAHKTRFETEAHGNSELASSSLRPGLGIKSRNMVGQLYLLLFLFYQAELFPDYKTRRSACLTYFFDHVTCQMIVLLKFGKSAKWW